MMMPMPSRRQILLIVVLGCLSGLSVVFVNASQRHENRAVLKTAAVDTFYVSPSGSNITGTGAKNSPWRGLAFALSKLTSDSLKPKALKLANGVYSAATTSESFPINLKSWISIVGGDNVNTIVDANKSAQTLVGQSVANILIDHLTIRNGFAKADTGDTSRGGGLMLRNSRQITVKNCVLASNEAQTQGGGIFTGGGSDIIFENNFIEKNNASDGAGVYCSRTKSAKFLANIIQRNTAKNSASVYIDLASPTLQRNRIRWNNANAAVTRNAGGVLVRSGNPIIGGALDTGNDIHDNVGGPTASQLYVIDNTTPVNARYNYWGAVPTSDLVVPAGFVDLSNYRNLAINIPLGTTDFYVAPNGADQNNGAKNAPWRTLSFAFTQIFSTNIDSLTINLAPGNYSVVTTGEQFPAQAKSHITVLGSSANQSPTTIISGEGVSNHELIRLEEVSELRLANLMFRNFKVNLKTGVILARSSDDLIIENCIFEDNQSQRGAAMTFTKVKSTEIRNNIFRRNHSTTTGGALMLLDDATNLTGNLFTDNSAVAGGGAVHCDSTSETRFIKNDFKNNSAGFGGAIYVTLSPVRIFNNRLLSNRATVSGGGAIALDGASLPQIGTRDSQANDIYLNTAMKGGAQIHRLDPGIKVDARYNYWGQIPDSTMFAPFGQFAAENFRQVSARMPFNTKAIYVSPTGNDAATGTSRSQALRTIGEALRLVFGIDKNPITVHLLPGKFANATTGETFPIIMESYLNLRGGGRDSTTVDAGNSNRAFEGRDIVGSVLADLNIVGGKATGYGGAIYLRNGTTASIKKAAAATIENCLLQNNSATHGGALAAVRNYKTIVRNCVISNNTAQQNGGAALAVGDSVEIKDSEIYSNRASANGGAVNADSAAALTLTNNRIHDNTAAQGGGVALTNGFSRIWRNFIIDNVALAGAGGGIYLSANGNANIGGTLSNGNDIYGNRAFKSGQELGSASRGDKIEARFNFFGGKPIVALVDNPTLFEVSSFRYVTITAPEKSREFYISPKGHDNNSGASKNSPWKTLAATLRRFFTEPGDSVRLNLQSGIYSAKTSGERLPLHLTSRVSLIGQHPDSVALDGESKTRLMLISNVERVNIRNLSLLNGGATSTSSPPDPAFITAGGVHIHKSNRINFEQVIFRGNKTNTNGGAVAADSSERINLFGCRFLENQGLGGGVYLHRSGGEIRTCEFRQNNSPNNGTAIYLSGASPKIINTLIVNNVSSAKDISGAIFCAGSSLPIIGGAAGQGNDIYNNTGGARGKALARQANTPVITASFNYFGDGNIGETTIYPLNGFDFRFSRNVPIVTNGKPVIIQLAPSANQPLRASRLDTVKFQVSAYDPDNDLLIYTWTLDDGPSPVGFGANYNFHPFFAGLGEHRIRVVVSDQKDTVAVNWKVVVSTTSVKDRKETLPKKFALQQNFPNPLRSAEALTVIPFQISKAAEVVLAIYDLLGRRVRLLEQSRKSAGFYSANWDGRDQTGGRVESGVYFIHMQAGEFTAMRKIVVTR